MHLHFRWPSEPEKWKTVKSALGDTDKTHDLCKILLVMAVPFACVLAAVLIWALA